MKAKDTKAMDGKAKEMKTGETMGKQTGVKETPSEEIRAEWTATGLQKGDQFCQLERAIIASKDVGGKTFAATFFGVNTGSF